MNTTQLQKLKMAWLAAEDAGDSAAKFQLLRDYPDAHDALVDFIVAYHAIGGNEPIDENMPVLSSTQKALRTALSRVLSVESQPQPVETQSQPTFANLSELRLSLQMKKVTVAQELRLGLDVWNKFENGAIELASLSTRQLERLTQFFHVSVEQFCALLTASQPTTTLNFRQTSEAASKQQGPRKQSFADAIGRSTMSRQDREYWLDNT